MANIVTFKLTQKQLTHTVHIVLVYFTSLLKVMKLHVQYHMTMRATDTQSNEDTQVLQRDPRLLFDIFEILIDHRWFAFTTRSKSNSGCLHRKQALYSLYSGCVQV